MTFLDLVRKRYSLRQYAAKSVPRDVIDRCLEAARLAPSACNSQPWTFLVADTEPARGKLASVAFGGIYSMNVFAAKAPVLIAVIAEHSKYAARLGGHLRGVQYNLVDLGIACEHLVLQAAEEGLGTCWLGWFNERAVRKELGLPWGTTIPLLISAGYPGIEPPRKKNRKSLEEIRRYRS